MSTSRLGFISTIAAVLAAQHLFAAPAHAAAPTGCNTTMEWVLEGSNYYFGRGSVQCTSGRYNVKLLCRNRQTGVGYVVYGGTAVNAPSTASTKCNTGNTVEGVFAVEDPKPVGVLTGCTPWAEWVTSGSSSYFGRGKVQCDTGRYKVYIQCRSLQTGQGYVISGSAVDAPNTSTTTCNSGHRAESVFAAADPRPSGMSGCATWREWVQQSGGAYYGRGSAQCASGGYKVRLSCRNIQTGATYINDSAVVSAPYTATTTCYSGNVVDAVQVIAQ